MTGKDALRGFISGEHKHIPSEGVALMSKSIEEAKDERGQDPVNIAVDIRLLKQLLLGYEWAVVRGYVGER